MLLNLHRLPIAAALFVPSIFGAVLPAEPVSVVERACTVPANSVKNPGFESGALAPWTFTPTYPDNAFASIAATGQSSGHSVQLQGVNGPGGPGSVGTLTQAINICSSARFTLQWSLLQAKGQTIYGVRPYGLQMSVGVYNPSGIFYGIADYGFNSTGYNVSTYGGSLSSPSGSHASGSWVTAHGPFPYGQNGTWTVWVRMFVNTDPNALKNSSMTLRLDNFVAKPIP